MFKLYKKLRPIDWVLLAVLVGLTFLQVYCTMTLVDFMKEVIQAITYLDYHNNPGKLGAALKELVDSLGGWDYVSAEVLAAWVWMRVRWIDSPRSRVLRRERSGTTAA